METYEIEELRKESLVRLVGELYTDIISSKKLALSRADDMSDNVRQACLSVLIHDFEINRETVDCLHSHTGDPNPLVRSMARLGLVKYFRGSGATGWRILLTDEILDEQMLGPERLTAYADLLRFSDSPPEAFASFCARLETATLADIDWQFVDRERSKVSDTNGTV